MVSRDDHGASADVDTDRELDAWQSLDFRDDVVVEFAADIVIDRHSDRHLGIGEELTLLWSEYDRNAFVVGEEEILLLLQSFRLGKRAASN